MKQSEVDNWRVNMQSRMEELTVLNAKHNQDIIYVKESLDELKDLIREQNGRVRELEGNMSGVKASQLNSKEMEKKIASAINEKIDIPFVSEEKEQVFFEKVVDVVTDLLHGLFEGK